MFIFHLIEMQEKKLNALKWEIILSCYVQYGLIAPNQDI